MNMKPRNPGAVVPTAAAVDVPFCLVRALLVARTSLRARAPMPGVLSFGRDSARQALRAGALAPAELVWSTAPFALIATLRERVDYKYSKHTEHTERASPHATRTQTPAPPTATPNPQHRAPSLAATAATSLSDQTVRPEAPPVDTQLVARMPFPFEIVRLRETVAPYREPMKTLLEPQSQALAGPRVLGRPPPGPLPLRAPSLGAGSAVIASVVQRRRHPRLLLPQLQPLAAAVRVTRAPTEPTTLDSPAAGLPDSTQPVEARELPALGLVSAAGGTVTETPALSAWASFGAARRARQSADAELARWPTRAQQVVRRHVSNLVPPTAAHNTLEAETPIRLHTRLRSQSAQLEHVAGSLRNYVQQRVAAEAAEIQARLQQQRPLPTPASTEPLPVSDAQIRQIMRRIQAFSREERFRNGKLA